MTTPPLVVVLPGYERFAAAADPACVERVAVGRFLNGELHVRVPESARGRRCVLVGSISPPAGNLERLTLVAHALRRVGARRVVALLPYLAYARQDRSAPSEGLGLAWVGGLLRASGIDEVVCVDAHSDAAGEVLGLPVTSLSPARLLASALPDAWSTGVSFVAPDEGAIPRCRAVADAVGGDQEVVYVRKHRTAEGVEHLGLVGSPRRCAVIVDDILDTGDTLVSCVRALRGAGAQRIGVLVTHALFTGDGWRPLMREAEHLWISDTVRSRRRPAEAAVVRIAQLLAPVLSTSSE